MRLSIMLRTSAVLVALICLLSVGKSLVPSVLTAQETTAQEETQELPSETPRKKPRGRVPNHYGKIGLTDAQKEEIYGIQAKYRQQIQELQEQINDLQQEEASEIYLVLTDHQKDALKKILMEVAQRRKQN